MENILKDMSADELLTLAMIAEIKEFKAAAGELKYSPNKLKTWDGDIDVAEFVLPKQLCVDEEECGGYDERPIILCDFDNGPVNVCVERVILRDGDYWLEGDGMDGSGQYQWNIEDCVTGQLRYVTEYIK